MSFCDKFVNKVLYSDQDPNVRKYTPVKAAKAQIPHFYTPLSRFQIQIFFGRIQININMKWILIPVKG